MYRSFAAVGTAAATRAAMSHASHASASADRRPQTGPGWAEVFISPRRAASTDGAAKSVAAGHSLLVLSGLASPAECQALRGETSEVAFASRRRSAVVRKALFEESVPGSAVAPGQVRMPISEMLSLGSQRLCDGLLLRSVTRVHRALPTLLPVLFGEAGIGNTPWEGIPPDQDKPARDAPPRTPVASPANNMSIARNPGLVFTPGEPACNVYTEGGQFKSHEDGGSLTVLVVLSERAEYGGGGTGFWSKDAVEPPASGGWWGALSAALATQAGPSFVLAPPEGTALVFGGQVLHAGEQVVAGERVVLVASFSNRGSHAREDTSRCGLRPQPQPSQSCS